MINKDAYKSAQEKYASLTGPNNSPSLWDAIEAYLEHANKHTGSVGSIKKEIEWTDSDEKRFRENHPYIGKGGTVTGIPVKSIYRGINYPPDNPPQNNLSERLISTSDGFAIEHACNIPGCAACGNSAKTPE